MRFPSKPRIILIFSLLTGLAGWVPTQSSALDNPAQICDQAAVRIAKEASVPLDVLRAITRTETGRGTTANLEPWPWTVNMQGNGVWFDTVQQAKSYVFRHFMAGARSFDIGCFQINYKWHSKAFNSIDEMFDPVINARYAARFLKQLYAQQGDWTRAVGAYHSKTHRFAQRYIRRYSALRENLPSRKTAPASPPPEGLSFLVGPPSVAPATAAQSSPASLFATETGG